MSGRHSWSMSGCQGMTPGTKMIITLVTHSGQISVTPALLPSASVYNIQISASLDKWNTGKQNRVTDANLIPSNHFINVRTFHLMSCFITICPNSALSASDPSIIGHWPHQCSASGHHLMNRKLFQIRQSSVFQSTGNTRDRIPFSLSFRIMKFTQHAQTF